MLPFLFGLVAGLTLGYVLARYKMNAEQVKVFIDNTIKSHREANGIAVENPYDVSTDLIDGTKSVKDTHEHSNHCWKRGILPGQVYVKTCNETGEMVKGITQEEWLRTL